MPLLIQLMADFIRDTPPANGMYGEALRCQILEDEDVGLAAYGMTPGQILILKSRDRAKFLEELSKEIGAIMDEVDNGPNFKPAYPAGVHLREAKVLYSNGNQRNLLIRGSGFSAKSTVVLIDENGNVLNAAIKGQQCDKDVWQRYYVDVTATPGKYIVRVTTGIPHADRDLVIV